MAHAGSHLASAVFADLVVACLTQFPAATVSAVAGLALDELLKNRRERAREILLDELRAGDVVLAETAVEESVAIAFRYTRAAQEGAARLNLRLMAQVIRGQAMHKVLHADEFLYWADIIASLKREEVYLIATLRRSLDYVNEDVTRRGEIDVCKTWENARDQLVPRVLPDEATMRAIAMGASRTGFLMPGNTFTGIGYFVPTPFLEKVLQLCDFDAALKKEPQ